MGIFQFFKKKKQEQTDIANPSYTNEQEVVLEQEENTPSYEAVNIHNKQQREKYISECCKTMIEVSDELEEMRSEYSMLTDYLKEIQMVEELPESQKRELMKTAIKIDDLKKERIKYQKNADKMKDAKYLYLEQFEEELPVSLKKLHKNEQYLGKIKQDMQHLEGEKSVLHHRKQDILKGRQNNKGILFIIAITLVIVLAVLAFLQFFMHMDAQIGYLISAAVAAAATGAVFMKQSRDEQELKNIEASINRAIKLLNSVKIKYVTTKNAIEYVYDKYHVHSGQELNYVWQQYMLAKKDKDMYQRTATDLTFYQEKYTNQLKELKISSNSVLLHQEELLIQPVLMEEMKQRLISRREKMKECMEYMHEKMQKIREDVMKLVKTYPEYAKEMLELVENIENFKEF